MAIQLGTPKPPESAGTRAGSVPGQTGSNRPVSLSTGITERVPSEPHRPTPAHPGLVHPPILLGCPRSNRSPERTSERSYRGSAYPALGVP
jgi:hypothetical protein